MADETTRILIDSGVTQGAAAHSSSTASRPQVDGVPHARFAADVDYGTDGDRSRGSGDWAKQAQTPAPLHRQRTSVKAYLAKSHEILSQETIDTDVQEEDLPAPRERKFSDWLELYEKEPPGWKDVDVFAAYRAPLAVTDTSEREFKLPLSSALRGKTGVGHTMAKLWRFVAVPTLLALIGVGSALVGTTVNLMIDWARNNFQAPLKELYPGWAGWVSYVGYSILMAFAACLFTQAVCPDATGGGIPEVKTVLSGVYKQSTLSFRMLVAKMVGLSLSNAAGLSVGREGPFVHMSCCLANLLMQVPCFSHIRVNEAKRIEILGCATAAGVASTFGTPFGAVIFAIEITSHSYTVSNLPQAFFCAVCGTILITLVNLSDFMSLFNENIAIAKGYTEWDLLFFAALGLLSGLLGVIFVVIVNFISNYRNYFLRRSIGARRIRQRQLLMVGLVTLVMSPAVYFDSARGLHGDHHTLSNYLFQVEELGLPKQLLYYVPFKFITTIMSVTLPLPVGLFTPVFIIGGAIGRIYGEWIRLHDFAFTKLEPWEFAVIGSAAFSTGVTRAVSTAVILFELSGENHLRLPLGVAILVAYFVSNRFTKNVYDALINTNGTPYLPSLPPSEYFVFARQVMLPAAELPFLTLESTYKDVKALLKKPTKQTRKLEMIPVVDHASTMALVGSVQRSDLKRAVHMLQEMNDVSHTSPVFLGIPFSMQGLHMGNGYDSEAASEGGSVVMSESEPGATDDRALATDHSYDGGAAHAYNGYGNGHGGGLSSGSITPTSDTGASSDLRSVMPMAHQRSDSYGSENGMENGGTGPAGGRSGSKSPNYPAMTRGMPGSTSQGSLQSYGLNSHLDWENQVQFIIYDNGTKPVPVMGTRRSPNPHLTGYSPLLSVPLDTSPYQVLDTMHLSKVDLIFRMLKVNHAYVTRAGRLIGVITRQRLREHLGEKEKRPIDSCLDLCCASGKTDDIEAAAAAGVSMAHD